MSAEHVANMSEMEIPENPFPGLRPFEFEESLLYFGRDGQSEQLLRKLSATRFLAVVGTSGSGKSSLVRAGLLPALLGGFMTSAGSNWRIALMRPGFDPIGNLARSLAAPDVLGSGGHQEILSAMAESTLSRGNFGLMDLAKQARIGPRQNLLIVADQFEELFRVAGFAESEAYRNRAAAFVKLLLEASRQRELPIYVVLTMRSDFLGDCSTFWGLPEAINEGQYLIPRLTREQRREAVTGPIAVCGGSITDRLVTRLLNDMGDDQDQLPLLQHALMRTWVKWSREGAERTAIDLEDYESIGGMSDALSMHVDEAFNSLPDDRSRQVAEKVFKGLTEKGSDNREIRRPVTLAGLSVVTGTAESELAQVIDTFRRQGRCFLMPPADVPLTSTAMIDISHESLIRNWRRLKEWVDEEARSARIYRRLAETAALYREGKAGLWRDPDLQVALTWREQSRPNKAWAARYHQDFDQAMDFLDKSLAERGAEQQAREAERRDKELRRSRQVRNARVTTAAVVVALMISLGTLVYANRQKQEAIRQKQEAIIQKEQASTNLEIAQANEALALGERTRFLVEKTKAEANAVLAERNGQTAFAQMTRADKEREQALHLLYAADFKQAYRAYRSKDFARADEILATIAPDSRGFEWHHLWNRYRSAEHTIRGYERPVTSVAFNPVKNNLLATGSADGTLALVDVVSGKVESLDTGASSIWGSIFSPDGKKVAVLGDVLGKSNKVELWDVSSKQSLGILPREERDLQVKCIAFWQAGKLVAGYEQGTIAVWDPEFPRNRQILPYPGPPKTAMPDVVALAGSPGGNILASGYEDGMLSIWRPGSLEHAEPSFDRGQITALAISPDGELLAAATKDGWLAIWVTSDIFRQEEFIQGHKQAVPLVEKELLSTNLNCLAFTEDGKMLAATRTDGAVALWNMQTLRDARSELDRLEQSRESARNESELKELEEGIQVVKTAASDSLKPGGDTLPSEHSGPVTSIAFSRDGQTFASGSSDRTVKVWRLGYDRNREEGVISPDGHLVAILEPDAIKILEDGKLRSSLALDARRKVSYLAFSPDNRAIVARLEDDTIKVFDPRGGERMELSKGAREVSSNARFVAEWDGEVVRVWDTSRGAVSHVFLPPAPSTTHSLCFSPDSKKVAVGYSDGTAKLYYLETAEELEIAKMGEGDERVRFSPDSKFLEMFSGRGRRTTQPATDDHVLSKTWNVKERRMAIKDELSRGQLEKVEAPLTVRSLANGKIASAQGESIVLSDGTKQTITQRAHLGQVTALDFSPNGRTLASGGLDGTVKLWDAKSLEYLSEIASLKKTNGSLNPVASLAFSRDGKRLAMGTDSGEGTLVLWDIAARQELLRLPERLPKASTFSAGDEALGSHTLGRIWLGEVETDRETVLPAKDTGKPGSPTWMSSRDEVGIPRNALIGGSSSNDKKFLHVCRLTYQNNVYVGDTSGSDCQIGNVGPHNGQFKFGIYEILVNAGSASWRVNTEEGSNHGTSNPRRIIVGTRADGKPVSVCRVTNQTGTYIGWTADHECHIWNGSGARGQVSGVLKFEILYENGIDSATTASSRRRSP